LGSRQAKARNSTRLTDLPETHEAVLRAFARGGIGSKLKDRQHAPGTSKWGTLWAVPRTKGSDDTFLVTASVRNVAAARIDGKVLISESSSPMSGWGGNHATNVAALRSLCLDEVIPFREVSDVVLRDLTREYNRRVNQALKRSTAARRRRSAASSLLKDD
jgi:hypothetical protein